MCNAPTECVAALPRNEVGETRADDAMRSSPDQEPWIEDMRCWLVARGATRSSRNLTYSVINIILREETPR